MPQLPHRHAGCDVRHVQVRVCQARTPHTGALEDEHDRVRRLAACASLQQCTEHSILRIARLARGRVTRGA